MIKKTKTQYRIEADLAGEMKFFTPDGCVNGHHAPFYTSNGHCSECQENHIKNLRERYHNQGLTSRGTKRLRNDR